MKWIEPIWGQQAGEPGEAYEAFLMYRDMGPRRTVGAVAKALGVNVQRVQRWRERWRWDERAREYEVEQERIAMKQLAERKATYLLQDVMVLNRLEAKALELLENSLYETASLKEIVMAIEVAVREKRAILGVGEGGVRKYEEEGGVVEELGEGVEWLEAVNQEDFLRELRGLVRKWRERAEGKVEGEGRE